MKKTSEKPYSSFDCKGSCSASDSYNTWTYHQSLLKQRVYDKSVKKSLDKPRELTGPSSEFLDSPSAPRLEPKVPKKQIITSTQTADNNSIWRQDLLEVKFRAYKNIMKRSLLPQKPRELGVEYLDFPNGTASEIKAIMDQRMVSTQTSGGISVECSYPASSTGGTTAGQNASKRKTKPITATDPKGLKRKTKLNDELSDSEVIVSPRVHIRGRARRRRTGNDSNSDGLQGMLSSSTFLHYFMHIWNDIPKGKKNSVAYFDPLWFNVYSKENNRDMALKWMKEDKDILSKQYVLVPIVLWSHWSLLIFCNCGNPQSNTTPSMLLLDSLHSIGPTRLEPLIRRLYLDLYGSGENSKGKKSLKKVPLLIPKVPQQKKGEECGYYALYYISLFVKNAPSSFNVSEGYPYFMKKDWFADDEVKLFYKWLEEFPLPVVSNDCDDDSSMDSGDCFELIENPFDEINS